MKFTDRFKFTIQFVLLKSKIWDSWEYKNTIYNTICAIKINHY